MDSISLGCFTMRIEGEGSGDAILEFVAKEQLLFKARRMLFHILGEQWFRNRGFSCSVRTRRGLFGSWFGMRLLDWIMYVLMRWCWGIMPAADRAKLLEKERGIGRKAQ